MSVGVFYDGVYQCVIVFVGVMGTIRFMGTAGTEKLGAIDSYCNPHETASIGRYRIAVVHILICYTVCSNKKYKKVKYVVTSPKTQKDRRSSYYDV